MNNYLEHRKAKERLREIEVTTAQRIADGWRAAVNDYDRLQAAHYKEAAFWGAKFHESNGKLRDAINLVQQIRQGSSLFVCPQCDNFGARHHSRKIYCSAKCRREAKKAAEEQNNAT